MKLLNFELVRFAIVGFVSNLTLYILYLVLTYYGVTPKIAMSLLYVIGMVQTFVFNRKWTFKHTDNLTLAILKYLALYVSGYFLNLVVLFLFVDVFGYSHKIVQGITIISLAIYFFIIQKFFVFIRSKKDVACNDLDTI